MISKIISSISIIVGGIIASNFGIEFQFVINLFLMIILFRLIGVLSLLKNEINNLTKIFERNKNE